jgi:hypothetical protein
MMQFVSVKSGTMKYALVELSSLVFKVQTSAIAVRTLQLTLFSHAHT